MAVSIIGMLLSFIPSIILYVYLRNLHGEEDIDYRKTCRNLLIKGILCSFGVFFLDLLLIIAWNAIGIEVHPLLRAALKCFIINAFVEELMKQGSAGRQVRKDIEKVSWLDCLAYFGISGIGFQIIETVVTAFSSGIGVLIVKGLTMGHPAYGLLMGYFAGKSLRENDPKYRIRGFVFLVLLHGMYNLSLSKEFSEINDNLVFVPFILIIVDLVILFRMVKRIKDKREDPEYSTPFSQLNAEQPPETEE